MVRSQVIQRPQGRGREEQVGLGTLSTYRDIGGARRGSVWPEPRLAVHSRWWSRRSSLDLLRGVVRTSTGKSGGRRQRAPHFPLLPRSQQCFTTVRAHCTLSAFPMLVNAVVFLVLLSRDLLLVHKNALFGLSSSIFFFFFL